VKSTVSQRYANVTAKETSAPAHSEAREG